MDAKKYIEQGIKDAIKDYLANNEFYKNAGIKRFEILDIMERPIEGMGHYHRYHVLIKHKEIDGWENCSAFQIIFNGIDLTILEPMFDGMARLDEGEFTSNSISYGSFTLEKSKEWLNSVEQKLKEVA